MMPEITDITFATRDECITYTASTEEIPLINCIQDINLISSTGGSNLAPTLSPNPVVTGLRNYYLRCCFKCTSFIEII